MKSLGRGILHFATPFNLVIEQRCWGQVLVIQDCLNRSSELLRVESGLDIPSQCDAGPVLLDLEDRFGKLAIGCNALSHVHLQSAQHNGDQSVLCQPGVSLNKSSFLPSSARSPDQVKDFARFLCGLASQRPLVVQIPHDVIQDVQ